jgi:hypothetical protein
MADYAESDFFMDLSLVDDPGSAIVQAVGAAA